MKYLGLLALNCAAMVALQLGFFSSIISLISMIGGNLSWSLPNLWIKWQVQRLSRARNLGASDYLKRFYKLELIKWILSMASFVAVICLTQDKIAALAGFIVAALVCALFKI